VCHGGSRGGCVRCRIHSDEKGNGTMNRFATGMLFAMILACATLSAGASGFKLNDKEYFECQGVQIMAYQDIYPEGHQGGVVILMHGTRIASNGDLRLDETPGQWQPVPKQMNRTVDTQGHSVTVQLTYPDSSRNRRGFNPILYPDFHFKYTVKTRSEGASLVITVDLDRPLPAGLTGKAGFNLELFPGCLFGKTWAMDDRYGIFPQQANGPGMDDGTGEWVAAEPMAKGRKLVVAPEDEKLRMCIESRNGELQLLDGRYAHNNGWFVVRTPVAEGEAANAVVWVITPHVIDGWISEPVIHVSQVGYHPVQRKAALFELDKNDRKRNKAELVRLAADGRQETVISGKPVDRGMFLRYHYLSFDFTAVKEPGVYRVKYGSAVSQPFRIGADVYERHVWQPTLEYFLPVQMCHMRVNEKYRVWHGLCHMDDARMAPVDHNHFDGYMQGPSTLTAFEPGEAVPGLNAGGWHDAGDYDLRVESQSGEVYILTQAYEAFGIQYDETLVDQKNRVVEIHQPDGRPDLLQQIEHGVLSIVGGYRSLGRFYRGIICPTLRQYVLLGDGSTMTDGLVYSPDLEEGERTGTHSAVPDDRWVFTEDNRRSELSAAAHLAAAGRVLRGFNDSLSVQCLKIAEDVYGRLVRNAERSGRSEIHLAGELLLTTGGQEYRDYILKNREPVVKGIGGLAGLLGGMLAKINDRSFIEELTAAARTYSERILKEGSENPFGVPYRPHIWGAGWDIQEFGVRQYFLHKAFPEIFSAEHMFNALEFILGVHPGSNTASFASGVGYRSAIVAYGVNRADGSYIPGGVVSGTALIRPDFPELLDWPYLWQQQEYVMGGGATNFMFLVLAARELLEGASH